MREQDIFVVAQTELVRLIGQIRDDHWALMWPEPTTAMAPDRPLRAMVNHGTADDAWIPDMLAGRTMDDVGRDRYAGDLLGDDPKGRHARYAERAIAAVRRADDMERPVHCSYGDCSTRDYFLQLNVARAMAIHDLAEVIGAEYHLPDEVYVALLEELIPVAETWREMGYLRAQVDVPDEALPSARFWGLTGRHP